MDTAAAASAASTTDPAIFADQANSTRDEVRQSLASNFDTFLTLLTTQLKNQDPTEPMESAEFTSQIAQFAMVEQTIESNDYLEKLVTQNQQGSGLVSYIGQQVEAPGSKGVLENGSATFVYDIQGAASEATINVLNGAGQVIFSDGIDAATGKSTYVWDGIGDNGQQYPDGAYTIAILAKDGAGTDVEVETYTTGKVTGVDFSGDEVMLEVGPISIPLLDVLHVSSATVANEQTTASDGAEAGDTTESGGEQTTQEENA